MTEAGGWEDVNKGRENEERGSVNRRPVVLVVVVVVGRGDGFEPPTLEELSGLSAKESEGQKANAWLTRGMLLSRAATQKQLAT